MREQVQTDSHAKHSSWHHFYTHTTTHPTTHHTTATLQCIWNSIMISVDTSHPGVIGLVPVVRSCLASHSRAPHSQTDPDDAAPDAGKRCLTESQIERQNNTVD